ncbi:MAG: hypothetical protein OIF38_09130 [Cellvibrionaceae bacterium]|nr:hypothetical protein [Cellvibrionaceae bacterium]
MHKLFTVAAVLASAQLAFAPAALAAKKQDYIKIATDFLAADQKVAADTLRFKQISTTGAFARVYMKMYVEGEDNKTFFCKIKKKNKEVKFCKLK